MWLHLASRREQFLPPLRDLLNANSLREYVVAHYQSGQTVLVVQKLGESKFLGVEVAGTNNTNRIRIIDPSNDANGPRFQIESAGPFFTDD